MALNDIDQARARVRIGRELNTNFDRVVADARIMADLGGDSLSCVEVLLAIEDEFKVFLPDLPPGDDPTVQEYLDLLAQVRR